jgi:glycosyltransferase involved in cell wall biosynthesis
VPDTLIIIPVLNEALSLPYVLSEISGFKDLDILVVDDASTDSSVKVCHEYGVKILPLKISLGAWGATQAGMRYALMHGYDSIITMDGDGQHHGFDIPKLLIAAKQQPDAAVVIGESVSRGSYLRHIAWRFFRIITGIGIEDITSGFRLYRHRAIELLTNKGATLLDYQDVGVLLMLKSAGLKVVETRVSTTKRLHGKSHLFSTWIKVGHYMIITTILAISKYRVKGIYNKE